MEQIMQWFSMIPWNWVVPTLGIIAALGILYLRFLERKRPVTTRSLLIPPLGMSTGAIMFLCPLFKVPWQWGLIVLLTGCLVLAPLLILTSSLTINDKGIVRMRSSPASFTVIILIILARLLFREWMEEYLSWAQTGGMAFLLAFGMLVPWRLALYRSYRKLQQNSVKKCPSMESKP
ncbi:CcdC family protein [Pasteuria penetrans]|uniref:CcdC family protein n=1 Tax=Pasteuria penetrans TaxID=86005 RepID=UPI000FA3D5A4|nr:cytochrome c biogenesis protein CcdC [Pasteuria penetrans]